MEKPDVKMVETNEKTEKSVKIDLPIIGEVEMKTTSESNHKSVEPAKAVPEEPEKNKEMESKEQPEEVWVDPIESVEVHGRKKKETANGSKAEEVADDRASKAMEKVLANRKAAREPKEEVAPEVPAAAEESKIKDEPIKIMTGR